MAPSLQGGLRLRNGTQRPNPFGSAPLETRLRNERGTVTMARWEAPDTGNGDFFINLADSPHLDPAPPAAAAGGGGRMGGYSLGFSVFGQVIDGMGVAERIAAGSTHKLNGMSMLDEPTPFFAELLTFS